MNDTSQPFLTDVKTLRERARQHIKEGPVTPSYGGDPKKTTQSCPYLPEGALSHALLDAVGRSKHLAHIDLRENSVD